MTANVSNASIGAPLDPGQRPMPGARAALVTLLLINLFNYIDRQVLAAVVEPIEVEFFHQDQGADATERAGGNEWVEAQLGSLQTAFMFSYILVGLLFGWLADRISRWFLIGVGVFLWSLASGASGLATTFGMLLLTRCFV
jgi:MFS transporter, Spinster family, sphingosine-1-phosphate transporter